MNTSYSIIFYNRIIYYWAIVLLLFVLFSLVFVFIVIVQIVNELIEKKNKCTDNSKEERHS